MSELSKFINLVIEYGEKVESTLNKKYRTFIRSICNLEQLAKSVDAQNICLTHEMIIFKLGLEAKSTKSIQVSLFYLHKFFVNKFIDLNVPNYCEQFEIQQTTVRKKQNVNPKNDFRAQLVKMLEPLVHFKSNQINILLLRVYEFLITEPIAPILMELNMMTPNTEIGQKILFNYYSYRFYIFQEIYTFTQAQFRSINPLSIRNQRISQQIQAAFVNHENLLDLVHKYVGQMVVAVAGIGGKYGLCVICKQPADYYCKITKASLCGADCKKRHLQIAQKQYKIYYQSVNLWKQIQPNFQLLLQMIETKESRGILSVFVALLQKAHLFMIVKRQFRNMIGKHVSGIINMVLNYKDDQAFQVIYNLVTVLCRYWMVECMSSIQYFFKQSVLKMLQDKKPNFKLLIILFKSLAKIFQYGKTSIELYINFDCEYNKTNIVERILFELSKICQDKFASTMYYNKHQKLAIKNGAVTLISILVKGLNQYRILYPQKITIQQQILQIKQRKINVQKFVHKFNQHWSEGLKMLFNLNMVGLESQFQIVDILLTIKGLKKQKIQQMLINPNGRQYIDILFENIIKAGPFMGLIQLFHVVPLKKSSILLKHYSDFVLLKMIKSKQDENDQKQQYSVTKWVGFLTTNYSLRDLQKWLYLQNIKINGSIDHVYMKCLETKNEITSGSHKTYFRHCISESYLQVFGSQLSLLQIPILFLLETAYSHEKIFEVIAQLIQICPHANWIALCLKNIDIQKIKNGKYGSQDQSLIIGCLKLCKGYAQFINQWSSILQFINKLYKIMAGSSQSRKKLVVNTTSVIMDEAIKTREELTLLQLQQYLLVIGQKCGSNFSHYIISLIHLSEQELQKQNIFFLQKTFQILQHNLPKFIKYFQPILKQLQNLMGKIMKQNLSSLNFSSDIINLKEQVFASQTSNPIKSLMLPQLTYSSQTLIYISDMLKQLFVKILKRLNNIKNDDKKETLVADLTQSSKQDIIELSFFKLFQLILQCQNREANDFVMNSISMIIMVDFNLKPQTWSYIVLTILKEYCKFYRQQTLTILQKILKEKLSNCEHLQFQLLNLAIDLVDQKQVKISIQSIHLLKNFVDLMIQQIRYRTQESLQVEAKKIYYIEIKQKQRMHVEQKQKQRKELQQKQRKPLKQEQGLQVQQANQNSQIQQGNQKINAQITQKSQIAQQQVKQSIQSNLAASQEPANTKQNQQSDIQQQTRKEFKKKLNQEAQNQNQLEQSQSNQSSSSSDLISASPKKIKQYLLFILSNLIEFILYQCHEGAIQILFILLKTRLPTLSLQEDVNKASESLMFQSQQIDLIINKIFKKLESLPKQLLTRGQKIMNQCLFWSIRNKKYGIVKNLQECIINKYSSMSYTAMKCIKTFISMTNPKKPQDWNPIQQTLVKILKNTHLADVLVSKNCQKEKVDIQVMIKQGIQLDQREKTQISIHQLSNKLIIQRMTVQVLPNDVKIIDELLKIYHQTLQFNDDIYLRCLLWRQGLGSNNKSSPPDILSLEELISYRIISTYYWSKQYEKIADFTLQIILRYCAASQKWQELEQMYDQMEKDSSNKIFELYMICKDYWQKRRQPLKVIINYMLPKLPKICKNYSFKQKLLNGIIQGMKFCDERWPYVQTIRQMTLVR